MDWFALACLLYMATLSTAYHKERITTQFNSRYRWECTNSRCEKFPLTEQNVKNALSLEACKMFCGEDANIWPKPTGSARIGSQLVHFDAENIVFTNMSYGAELELMTAANRRFLDMVKEKSLNTKKGNKNIVIETFLKNQNVTRLTLDVDESYHLSLSMAEQIVVTINAKTFFGARHALETLKQLIIYDNIRNELQIISNADIEDKPVYKYRGVLLDTSRNFYTVESIKRTIDGMAASKLNTFHWHITDSPSFPFVSKSQPRLSELGAYSLKKVYTPNDVLDVVEYGTVRGVRVMPEFDAPAHVGEGWQDTNLTVCFKAEPWRNYCAGPPCGQLNPTKPELYDILNDIYHDMFELFQPDIFHMGGDEVFSSCWNSSADIRNWMKGRKMNLNEEGFLNLWRYFQDNASERVFKANGNQKLPLIMWTSELTESSLVTDILPVKDYIIQIWTKGNDPQIKKLLSLGYSLIMSNYDALYLDCGFSTWVGEAGNNWCSPYIGWQNVYENSPLRIAGSEYSHLVLGGEAALWSEQSDSSTLDGRLWPRIAALAERLWTEPTTSWHAAEQRMLHFRERLVDMGIAADSIQPFWCLQNEGHCY